MNTGQQEILGALHNCIVTCNECFDACLSEHHVSSMAECIRLDRDCSEICSLLVQAISRNSSNIDVFLQEAVLKFVKDVPTNVRNMIMIIVKKVR